MLIPYRAKNPPDSLPYCTLALIAVNVLVFLCTTSHLQVTDDAVDSLAVSASTLNPVRLVTAMFLHADIFHIGGNMLFLWIFGAAVEGRLRHWRFLLLYFGAGLLGGWLSALYYGRIDPDIPGFGASGAIMGALGAYLYMFPFSQIRVFWWFFIRFGVVSVQAMWIIGFFVLQDLFENYLFHGADGTGHVAHLAGAALGYGGAMAMRARVDSERSSSAKSTLADMGDVSLLSLRELDALLQHPTDNVNLVLAYCRRCPAESSHLNWPDQMSRMIQRHQTLLMEQAEPLAVARLLLALPPNAPAPLPCVAYLRVGGRLEQAGYCDEACRIYRRVYELDCRSRDAETALYRYARLKETAYANPQSATRAYSKQLRSFPHGSLALSARDALARLGGAEQSLPAKAAALQPPPTVQSAAAAADPEPASAPFRPACLPDSLPEPEQQRVMNGLEIGTGRKIEL